MSSDVELALIGLASVAVAGLPATIAAVNARRARKNTKTTNGHTLAQLIELHIAQDSHNFDVLADRLGIPRRDLILPDEEIPDI